MKLSSTPPATGRLLNHYLGKPRPLEACPTPPPPRLPRWVCPPLLSSLARQASPQGHEEHSHLVVTLASTLSQPPAPTAVSSLHPVFAQPPTSAASHLSPNASDIPSTSLTISPPPHTHTLALHLHRVQRRNTACLGSGWSCRCAAPGPEMTRVCFAISLVSAGTLPLCVTPLTWPLPQPHFLPLENEEMKNTCLTPLWRGRERKERHREKRTLCTRTRLVVVSLLQCGWHWR